LSWPSLEDQNGVIVPTRQSLLGRLSVVMASYSTTGNTGAVTNAINFTPPALSGTYRLSGYLNMTAWTTPATFNVLGNWKDQGGSGATSKLLLIDMITNSTTVSVTAAHYYVIPPHLFTIDTSATAITVSTNGTFTGSPVYNLAAILEQVA
jgi:hypothetical protein